MSQEKTNRIAKDLFQHFKQRAENEVHLYNGLKTIFPYVEFPRHAGRIWRLGMLSEIWGTIATKLSKDNIDYLKNWREGK